ELVTGTSEGHFGRSVGEESKRPGPPAERRTGRAVLDGSVIDHEEVTRAAREGVIHEPRWRSPSPRPRPLYQSRQGREGSRALRTHHVGLAVGAHVELRAEDRSLPGREARVHAVVRPVDHATGTGVVVAGATGVRRLRI